MRQLLLVILLIVSINIFGQPKSVYIGFNTFAPCTEIDEKMSRILFPVLSNMETGIGLSTGIIHDSHNLEGRVSFGTGTELYNVFQLHLGYNSFFLHHFDIQNDHVYTGIFLKYMFQYNKGTEISFHHVIPYLTAGYRFFLGDIFVDIRLNQTIYAFSSSSDPNSSWGHNWFFFDMERCNTSFTQCMFYPWLCVLNCIK